MSYLSGTCKFALIFIAFLILTGCATTNRPLSSRTIAEYSVDQKDEGLVVLSTVIHTGEAGQISSIVLEKQPSDGEVTDKKGKAKLPTSYLLYNKISQKSNDLSLFFNPLPAGNYKIIRFNTGNKYIDLKNSLLGEISVVPGKTIDLGMIVITAANFELFIGRSEKFTDSSQLVDRFFPEETIISKPRLSGWSNAKSEKDIAEIFALNHVQGIQSIAELATGEIVAGTRLGTLLKRNQQNKWRILLRLDFYDAFTYVASLPDSELGDFIGVTDYFKAYRINGNQYSELNLGDLPSGRIYLIDYNEVDARWYIAVVVDNKLELFSSTQLEKGQWELVKSADISFSSWSGAQYAWFTKANNGLVFAASRATEISCFDYQNNQWTNLSVPDKRSVIDLRVNPITGALSILTSPGGGFGGVFAKSYVSNSCTENWTQIKTPYSVEVAAPIPMNDGSLVVVGGVFGDEGIYGSIDGGKKWSKLSDEKVLTQNFFQSKNNGIFMISKGSWGVEYIQQSDDEGKTWDTELSSINYEMLKASQKSAEKKVN